jgi:hypothetical protein
MTDGEKPALRGEAAWLADRERIAKRNAEARKAGKLERDTIERQREGLRREAEVRRATELARSSGRG